ncbi:MAG: glycosyltransferase family 4 protein [bacterium]|nr:glycosyltransferase family 4 protein [bacterium]
MYRILMSAMGYDNGKSGISEYIRSTAVELAKNHKVDLIILKKELDKFPYRDSPNLNLLVYSDRYSKPLVNMLWHLFILPFFINYKKYDFIFLPAGNRRLFCRYPLTTYVTMHDLSQYHVKNKYDKFRMFYIKKIVPYFLKKADWIFSISESTKKDLLRYYKLDEQKIIVNYNGFDSSVYDDKKSISKPEIEDLDKAYILYVARIEHPGKNHINLIKAYEKLSKVIKKKYDLVLAGSLWNGGEIVKKYAENSDDSENIKFLGFVKNADMPGLYSNASLYAFPSLYEGFGIPILEAMSCGIPVICSNTSSLPEVGGDAVYTFKPKDPDDIKDKIESVLNNDSLVKKMVTKGHRRVKNFSWEKHCNIIVEKYENEQSTGN